MKPTLVLTIVFAATVSAQQPYVPARYSAGVRPQLPALAVGGGQVYVELDISPTGGVTKVTPLRVTPAFTDVVVKAVSGWQFSAAKEDAIGKDGKPQGPTAAPAKVMVAGLFRPPSILTPTQGAPPATVAAASPGVAFPMATPEPPYPPNARGSGVVLIEARVDASGKVADATVVGSAGVFDAPALDAAKKWQFRPANVRGRATTTFAYLLFGFAEPIAP
jgi:TonB family protein